MKRQPFAAPLAAALLVTACATVTRPADDPTGPVEPGRYAFDGQTQGEHRYRNRTERESVSVSGTIEVHDDGRVHLLSTHGGCTAELPSAGVAVSCPGVAVSFGGRRGTARVPFQQIQERQDGCEEYVVDATGRPTGQCRVIRWTEQRRTVQLAVPIHVTRVD